MKYAFQMVGLGKEIYQVCLLHTITRLQQRSQISRERRRIARHVCNSWSRQLRQISDHTFAQPGPWRIHNYQIRLQLAGCVFQILFHSRTHTFYVRSRIV